MIISKFHSMSRYDSYLKYKAKYDDLREKEKKPSECELTNIIKRTDYKKDDDRRENDNKSDSKWLIIPYILGRTALAMLAVLCQGG
ncbi:MAG: hypothetical protein Harvfovirus32_5 [Harvfovirus sp.]|uniref:Uncharacterized protein n=1 Tax=Harvfovirus sp. TaxID=2487768 RepID=A0A3G5A7I2_9VIRU|nr:MAG: hypothetical protein Harvfovirus32_5 [Harvfovirus sp.]